MSIPKRTTRAAAALIIAGLAMAPGLATARDQSTTAFTDRNGRPVGRAETSPGGQRTDFYRADGRREGRAETRGSRTDIYDANGRRVGSAQRR